MESSELQTTVVDERAETSPPPSRKRIWPWLLLALLALGGIGVWRFLASREESPSNAATQPQATRVRLSTVETATIQDSTEYIATLESRRSVNLLPQIQGRVGRILVREGDNVPAGRPLIQVNPDEQQAVLNSANAAIAAARATVENARATLSSLEAERVSALSDVQFNQKEYQRYSALADQGAVARSLADQYTNRIQTARASLNAINKRIAAAKATVAQEQQALAQAQAGARERQVQLDYYQISAPFAGTVGDIPVKVGDFVTTSTRLTSVTENRPLEVNISVPVEQGPQLRQGMPVELLNGQGKTVGTSRVFFIAPNTANNTQSILVKSLFDNAQGQLRADQYVRARVIWEQRPGVLIPTTAVNRIGGQSFVFVAQQAPQKSQEQAEESQEHA